MSKAHVDPAELRRFAQDLTRFNTDFQTLLSGLYARMRGLEATWQDQEQRNVGLRATFEQRGLVFNDVDQGPFRAKLGGVYAAWKEKLGAKCWSLLEASTGKLA